MPHNIADPAAAERERIAAILDSPEASGRMRLASQLAGVEGLTIEQARETLVSAPIDQNDETAPEPEFDADETMDPDPRFMGSSSAG